MTPPLTSQPASRVPAVVKGNKPLPKTTIWPKTSNIGPKFIEKAMPWFENFWHTSKRYPSKSEIIQHFGFTPEQVTALNNHKFWLTCLDRRGITRPLSLGEELSLTDRQIAAISILTNFNDTRSPVAKLAKAGITAEELAGWRSNPVFQEALKNWTDDMLDNIAPDAAVELARAIKKGNFPAIKFYYEITGRANSPEAINVKQAMNVLIEAVQKHVKDPEVLQAIANEVNNVRALGS